MRGGIVIRADEIRKEMEHGGKQPFDALVPWNIGNPQNLGQLPITFPREVLSYLYTGISSYSQNIYSLKIIKMMPMNIQMM